MEEKRAKKNKQTYKMQRKIGSPFFTAGIKECSDIKRLYFYDIVWWSRPYIKL